MMGLYAPRCKIATSAIGTNRKQRRSSCCLSMATMFGAASKRFWFGMAIILLLVLGACSVLYRLSKEKPFLKPDFLDSRFNTSWRSGRSDRNILARLTEAKSLLWIIVTRDHLHVSPHFPFNLMFLPEAFGWDHRIPGKTIMDVRETHGAPIKLVFLSTIVMQPEWKSDLNCR